MAALLVVLPFSKGDALGAFLSPKRLAEFISAATQHFKRMEEKICLKPLSTIGHHSSIHNVYYTETIDYSAMVQCVEMTQQRVSQSHKMLATWQQNEMPCSSPLFY